MTRHTAGAAQRSRELEAVAALDDETWLKAARQRWQSLDLGQQLELAQALADARRSEFVGRYKAVVQVAAGLKRRRDAAMQEYMHREACVVFMVRRKLSPVALDRQPGQRLPTELLTPGCVDGRCAVVAVPTDVQSQQRLIGARAQGGHGVHVGTDASFGARGTIACALASASRPSDARFVLAPIHVLTVDPPLDGRGMSDQGRVYALQQGTPPYDSQPMLRATAHGARLRPAPALSLDAQFAEVVDRQRLAAAIGWLRLSETMPWVRDLKALGRAIDAGAQLEIAVPANHLKRRRTKTSAVAVTLSLGEYDQIFPYHFAAGTRAVRQRLVELQWLFAGEGTLAGDSGSPVLLRTDHDAASFAGMHIAANRGRRVSYMIPAWALLNPERYAELGGSTPTDDLRLFAQG